MRSALTIALLIAFCGTAAAQRHAGRPVERAAAELPRPSIGLPLPRIGLPLPQIGLPLAPLGLSPLPSRTSGRIAQPQRFARPERSGRFERSDRRNGGVFLYVPAFGWPFPYLPETVLPSSPVPSLPTPLPPFVPAAGYLRLDLPTTMDPQIYLDGYYIGLLSDTTGELTLDAGTHAIELRQEGYESLHLDVQIAADAITTYRGGLKHLASASAVAPPPSAPAGPPPAPTTIYMIPGCYVGNVPPKDAMLPSGCDAGGAVVFPSRQ
jgi:hypothetical protein